MHRHCRAHPRAPAGATYVDARFLGFVNELFGAERFALLKHHAIIEILSVVETEKKHVGMNPAVPASDNVVLPINSLIDACQDAGVPMNKTVIDGLVAAYNTAHGLASPDAVVFNNSARKITIPPKIVRSFFAPNVSSSCDMIRSLLDDTAERRTPIDHIIIAGGFAESRLFSNVRHIAASFDCLPCSPTPRPPGDALADHHDHVRSERQRVQGAPATAPR